MMKKPMMNSSSRGRGLFNKLTPQAGLKSKMPDPGGKLKVKKVPKKKLEALAKCIVDGTAFSINPDEESLIECKREANITLGTMIINYRVHTSGEKIFGIGYTYTTKIEVLLASQAGELLEMVEKMGKDDFKVYILGIEEDDLLKIKYKLSKDDVIKDNN